MSKRNNKVWLEGFLTIHTIETQELDGETVPVVNGLIATDRPEQGGHHPFIAYNRLAVETISFVQAVGDDGPPQALIEGWLRSTTIGRDIPGDGLLRHSLIVANNITFVVSKEIRIRAQMILNQALQGKVIPCERIHNTIKSRLVIKSFSHYDQPSG